MGLNGQFNARIQRLEKIVEDMPSGREVPTPSVSDEGKVPTVDSQGNYVLETPQKELPPYTASDDGKVLTVDGSGDTTELVWREGGVGGDLPAYTISDKGKVLTLADDPEHITRINIVPEQSVTVSDGQAVELTGIDSKYAVAGIIATLTVDGNSVEVTSSAVQNQIMYFDMDAMRGIIFVLNDGVVTQVVYLSNNDGTYNISLTTNEPDVTPAWKGVASGIQICEVLTDDNAPAPPEGYTPENYYVYVNANSDKTELQNVVIASDDKIPALIPTFINQQNMSIIPVVASKSSGVFSPIESSPTGDAYILTIKESISDCIVCQLIDDNSITFYIFNASNLEWVKAESTPND